MARLGADDRRELADIRIDGERLWSRIVALGEIGAIMGPAASWAAPAWPSPTPTGRAATSSPAGWSDLGLTSSVDAIGNVVATRPGTDPGAAPVMTGSHIDTVATGGRFDGNLGVLAGLEVIETLETLGIATRRPISVAFFTDEEGARFAPDMLGSLVYVGGMALEEALDITAVDDGARLGDELVPHRLRRAVPVPGGVGAARLRRAAHRAGTDPRGRGCDDRRRRRRAGHLLDRVDDHRTFRPCRHDADAAAPRSRLRGRGDHDVRA